MIDPKNSYTLMQKRWYNPGTNNHEEHNKILTIGIFYLKI